MWKISSYSRASRQPPHTLKDQGLCQDHQFSRRDIRRSRPPQYLRTGLHRLLFRMRGLHPLHLLASRLPRKCRLYQPEHLLMDLFPMMSFPFIQINSISLLPSLVVFEGSLPHRPPDLPAFRADARALATILYRPRHPRASVFLKATSTFSLHLPPRQSRPEVRTSELAIRGQQVQCLQFP